MRGWSPAFPAWQLRPVDHQYYYIARAVEMLKQEEEMENLMVKTVAGFAFLMLVLALALFVSAGSLGFWQAWVYLAVFALCTILVTAYLVGHDQRLLASRVKAGPVAETQKGQQII